MATSRKRKAKSEVEPDVVVELPKVVIECYIRTRDENGYDVYEWIQPKFQSGKTPKNHTWFAVKKYGKTMYYLRKKEQHELSFAEGDDAPPGMYWKWNGEAHCLFDLD